MFTIVIGQCCIFIGCYSQCLLIQIIQKMNIDFYSKDELQLRFADDQHLQSKQTTLVNHYTPIQNPPINFYDLFDLDQSNSQSQKSQGKFFSNKNQKQQKQSKHELTIKLKQSLGNLKTRKKTIHHTNPFQMMKTIYNIVIPANYQQLMQLFLNSNYFNCFIRLITMVNFIAILLINYSFRITEEPTHSSESSTPSPHSQVSSTPHSQQYLPHKQLVTSNIVSLCLQLFSNCVFTLQIMLRIYQNSHSIKDPYVIINTIGTICCWATIFFDMIENDSNQIFKLFMMVRIIRAIIRILEVFPFLRTPFEIFINTIPSLQKLFFPLIILMLFYAIAGMALFSGASKYRCVSEAGVYGTYCGTSLYSCHQGQTCKYMQTAKQRGVDSADNQFNLVTFDNIGKALLTIYHFIYNTNFSIIRGKFTYFVNPYIASLFFVSSSIIFCYIFSNLIMVSMSKAYIEQVESKAVKEQKVQIESEQEKETSLFARTIEIVNIIVIVSQTIVLCLTYKGMSDSLTQAQSLIDFILMWVSSLILIAKIIIEKGAFISNPFNIISVVTIGAHLVNLVICSFLQQDLIYSVAKFSIICKTLKILRIVQLPYINEHIFTYQKYVINVFLQTLYKIKFFIVMILCFIFMFKQLGQLLFAYEVRFPLIHSGESHSAEIPYINNFQGFFPSFFSILYLFFNETWSETMYHYYYKVGYEAVFFFVIVTFISFLMLMRLYIAVFLCYFKAELRKQAKKELNCANNRRKDGSSLTEQQSEDKVVDNQQGQQPPTHWLIIIIQSIYRSVYFDHGINVCILAQSIVILLKQSNNPQQQLAILNIIQNLCFACYIIQVIMGCLCDGLYQSSQSFLKKSKSNVISFVTMFIIVGSFLPYGNIIITNYLRRITIVKIFTLFRNSNKEMSIVIDSIFVICKNFFNFVFIYIFFLIIISIVPLKLFYNHQPFHVCMLAQVKNDLSTFYTEAECASIGGAWTLPQQNFNNIFQSLALMYQLISTQSWTAYLQSLWWKNNKVGWQFYFSFAFFIYNICFLNIFLGFIVETYLQLKDKAYNLNLLKKSQIGWILIKNRINALFPKSVLSIDPNVPPKRKLIFSIVSHESYETACDYLAYTNAFLYLITYEDQSGFYNEVITFFKKLFCAAFVIDSILKVYGYRSNMFFKDNSVLQFLGSVYICIYWAIYLFCIPNNEERHILQFVLVVFLLIRCKSLLLKYSWCKTNLNSVIDILPKCVNIIKLVCVVLFFYASIGLQIFKYVKKDNIVDEYNIGFNNILTAIITLLKVSVAQSWHTNLSAFIKQSSEEHTCYHIYNEESARMYGTMGCGTWAAYPYFLSFHIIMVLLVINLLIATMASAYDDNYQIEYNSINIFQLEDCLNLWQKYDPTGTGVVQYKKFWRLTSEIAILFGISKKKLIKRKNKFFEQLDLQIYQHKTNPMFCYRFHDVITKFSKIKLQIANLQQDQQNTKNNEFQISFDICPKKLKQIKDYVIPFPEEYYGLYQPFSHYKSGETKYIFGLLKKIRQWKRISTQKKKIAAVTKLSSIFDLKSKRFQMEPDEESLDSIV